MTNETPPTGTNDHQPAPTDVWPDPFGRWTADQADAARQMKTAMLAAQAAESAELRAHANDLRQAHDTVLARLNDACATIDRLTTERDDARTQLTALDADQTDHVIEIRDTGGGFFLKHPLSCRPALFDCPVHHAAENHAFLAWPDPGRYLATLDHDGWIVIGDQTHADGQVTDRG